MTNTFMERIPITEFLELMKHYPAFDVRTPKEFAQGRIPGAMNLPIFTNEERAVVGTIYKQTGREKAILVGLDIVGPKMRWLADGLRKKSRDGTVLVHCWRGGMRSESVAWLAEFCGLKAITLDKGYKSYRTWALERFAIPRNIIILGGKTGSGKTDLLKLLASQGEQIIDLEGIAHHKGSVFGALGEKNQPSQEQFENELAYALSKTDTQKNLWFEDESRQVGWRTIPKDLWEQMRTARVVCIDISFTRRTDYLLQNYGSFNPYELISATQKIHDKLGPDRTRECIDSISSGNIRRAIEVSLEYYDRSYAAGFLKRSQSTVENVIVSDNESFEDAAKRIAGMQ